jgi:cysteinyl-tRNA synthetase
MKLYNTLTRTKEPFVPLIDNTVSLYVCGMTVYDFCHIGHARVMVFFDVVARHFRHLGYAVHYVRNITDIDDKIITRANENREEFHALTERFIAAMHEDAEALHILPPDAEPRATHSMHEILAMIAGLIDNGLAYVADNGDVYYAVRKFSGYGKLSGKNTDELQSGARVSIGEEKRDPLDFALWKSAKPDEPAWDSPWGKGRPGWHIECSAMSRQHLGDRFDIHGGGMDLIFPHHENEIAQSEGCVHHQHVNTWMHVGFVRINDEKMSKSLNNFFTIREVLADFHPEVVRLFLLSSHYRSPLNYSRDNLEQAKAGLTRLYTSLREEQDGDIDQEWVAKYDAAMADDINTPEAVAVLYALSREINRNRPELAPTLRFLGTQLGILYDRADDFLQSGNEFDATEIEEHIAKRNQARKDRDFATADAIRDALLEQGIVLEDQADGTIWRKH